MIKAFLLSLFLAVPALADTGTIYLTGCAQGTRAVMRWVIPTPGSGTHVRTPTGWLTETPLNAAYLEFVAAYKLGCKLGDPCYRLTLDVDADTRITAHDFRILVGRWTSNPAVVGTHSLLPVRGEESFPPNACVTVSWTPGYFAPTTHLYQGCIDSSGSQIMYPEGQWNGPAKVVTGAACEGGNF